MESAPAAAGLPTVDDPRGHVTVARPTPGGPLHDIFDKRVALVTGKGGVGRTTVSAALARAAARRGIRVLLTEIGEPDGDYTPLARLFGRDTLPAQPEELEPGVMGCVLWARAGHEGFFRRVLPVQALAGAAMRSGALRRLLDSAPSFREMGVFYHFFDLLERKRPDGSPTFELTILDMPASGHTLGLTGLRQRLLALMPTGPIADVLNEGRGYFHDPALTGAWIVTLPEILPVTECLELVEGLEEHKTPVGGILVNRLLEDPFTPEERAALQPYADEPWLGMQRFAQVPEAARALERLRTEATVPIAEIPEFPLEGDPLLDAVADALLEGAR